MGPIRLVSQAQRVGGLAAIALVAMAAPAFAAEDGYDDAKGSSGLPQFAFETWPAQIFWLLIAFGLLYFVLSRSLLPQLGAVIEDRQDKIADDVDEASRLNRQAEEAQQAYEKSLADARAKASAVAQDTRDAMNAEIAREVSVMEADLAKRADAAEVRIREAADAAMANVRIIAADAASDIVTKLAGGARDASVLESAVNTASATQ